ARVIEGARGGGLAGEFGEGAVLTGAVEGTAKHEGVLAGAIDVVVEAAYLRVIVECGGRVEGENVEVESLVGSGERVVAGGVLLHEAHDVGTGAEMERVDGGDVLRGEG